MGLTRKWFSQIVLGEEGPQKVKKRYSMFSHEDGLIHINSNSLWDCLNSLQIPAVISDAEIRLDLPWFILFIGYDHDAEVLYEESSFYLNLPLCLISMKK